MSVTTNNSFAKLVDAETKKCLVGLLIAFIKQFEQDLNEEEKFTEEYKVALTDGLLISTKRHYEHLTESIEYHFKSLVLTNNKAIEHIDENKFFVPMSNVQPVYFSKALWDEVIKSEALKDERLSFVKFKNQWGLQIEITDFETEEEALDLIRTVFIKINKSSSHKMQALREMVVSFSHQYIFDDDFIKGVVKSNFDINQMFVIKHS